MPDKELFRSPEAAERLASEIIAEAGRSLTPTWPAHEHHNDLIILSVHGRGIRGECNGVPMIEVQPVWWRRLFNALTPWRLRTRVFTNRV